MQCVKGFELYLLNSVELSSTNIAHKRMSHILSIFEHCSQQYNLTLIDYNNPQQIRNGSKSLPYTICYHLSITWAPNLMIHKRENAQFNFLHIERTMIAFSDWINEQPCRHNLSTFIYMICAFTSFIIPAIIHTTTDWHLPVLRIRFWGMMVFLRGNRNTSQDE